jgi:ketosteroid isomerase-like protein
VSADTVEAAAETALAFNDAINRQDLDPLVALMTPDHLFVDSAGSETRGRDAMRAAWHGFFAAFPDYRNLARVWRIDGDAVLLVGRSECRESALAGPAIWKAVIRGSKVAEWRVYDDSSMTRRELGMADHASSR